MGGVSPYGAPSPTQPAQVPNPNNDFQVANPPNDGISSLSWSPVANFLVATAWDGDVYCYEVGNNGQAVPKASQKHEGPVLCSDWSHDGTAVFSGGCDNKAQKWDLATNTPTQVAQHDAPIRHLCWIKEVGLKFIQIPPRQRTHCTPLNEFTNAIDQRPLTHRPEYTNADPLLTHPITPEHTG